MTDKHTPGFYALEEYRCKDKFEHTNGFSDNNPNITTYRFNIILDRINALQNTSTSKDMEIDYAEEYAYKQQEQKTSFFQKIKQLIK